MSASWRRILAIVLVLVMLGGCVGAPTPTQRPTSFDPAPSLATIPALVCHTTPITGELASDPRDPHVAWLVTPEGERVEVIWPTGYTAQFTWLGEQLVLEVFDNKGRPYIATNASPRKTCDAGRPGTVLLMQTAP